MDRRLGLVLRRICREIGWNCAEAWAADHSDGQVRMIANWCDGSPSMRTFASSSESRTFSPGTGLPGRVIHFNREEVLEDLESLPDTIFLRKDEARAAGIKSAIGVPVGTRERTYAALIFFRVDEATQPREAYTIAARSAAEMNISANGHSRPASADHPLLRKMARFTEMGATDAEALLHCFGPSREFKPGEPLKFPGSGDSQVMAIESGWACVQRLLADGGRQITRILLPGDMVGLVVEDPRDIGQEVRAITPVTANVAPLKRLDALFRSRPDSASALYWMALWEQSFLAARLTDIGRRSAFDRVAHLALDVYQRISFLEPRTNGEIEWPLTQETLADALGLSAVHVNRTLKKLKAEGFIASERGRLRFDDVDALVESVGFDWSDLYAYRGSTSFGEA